MNSILTIQWMNAVEFVSFDNDIQTRGMTDEEIVGSVQSMSEDREWWRGRDCFHKECVRKLG